MTTTNQEGRAARDVPLQNKLHRGQLLHSALLSIAKLVNGWCSPFLQCLGVPVNQKGIMGHTAVV